MIEKRSSRERSRARDESETKSNTVLPRFPSRSRRGMQRKSGSTTEGTYRCYKKSWQSSSEESLSGRRDVESEGFRRRRLRPLAELVRGQLLQSSLLSSSVEQSAEKKFPCLYRMHQEATRTKKNRRRAESDAFFPTLSSSRPSNDHPTPNQPQPKEKNKGRTL